MRQSIFSLFIIIVALICMMNIGATETEFVTDNGLWSYEYIEDNAILTAYHGSATDVYVPSNIEANGEKLDVVKLGDSIFENNDALNSVTLGAGVTELGDRAFYDADNLVCILLAEDTTTIGTEAFYSCDNFNSVILYDAVTTIDENAFAACPKLTVWCNEETVAYTYVTEKRITYKLLTDQEEPEIILEGDFTYYIQNGEAIATKYNGTDVDVVIPATVAGYPVTTLRETFKLYKSLESIVLPESITTIGVNTFYQCSSLVTVMLPDSVRIIGDFAFFQCYSLVNIIISENVITIGDAAFSQCTSLTVVNFNTNLTSIGNSAFADCYSLRSISIPNSVTSIGMRAFLRCSGISSVTISNSIDVIDLETFAHCTSLASVIIPEGISKIGGNAFVGCINLRTATIPNSVTSLYYAFPESTIMIVNEGSYAQTVTENRDLLFFICEEGSVPEFLTENGITYYIMNGEAIAIDCDEDLTEITIPQTVNGYPITKLVETFWNCESIISVVLSENLQRIGSNAFNSCKNLKSISISNSVISIGKNAFYNCKELGSVTVPNGVTSIGQSAFSGCSSLISAILSENITTIERNVFQNCKSLSNIIIPKGVAKIESFSFCGCTELSNITIPNSVTSIGQSAFQDCSSLISISLPNSITSISSGMFSRCTSLRTITIPDNVSLIESAAFSSCSNLTSITIPDTVTNIGDRAFQSCVSLNEISLPNSLSVIGKHAFDGCGMPMIVIPTSVESIDVTSFLSSVVLLVFEGSYAHTYAIENDLLYFVYDGTTIPEVATVDGIVYVIINDEAIAIDCDDAFTEVIVPPSVKNCPVIELRETFRNCSDLVSVTLPSSLNCIGKYAFYACYKLSTITIPENVTIIDNYAFYNCSKLNKINIPSNATRIGDYAFWGCYVLKDVVIPDGVSSIGAGAFWNCDSLLSVILPDSIRSIGVGAFGFCDRLTAVTLPCGLTSIESSMFSNCPALKSITIPDSVNTIGQSAFSGCSSLLSISIPQGVTSIEAYTFSQCSNLHTVILPDTLTRVAAYSFNNCAALQTVVIPKNVTYMLAAFPQNTVLLVYENSYAHNFAVDNNLLYFVLHKTENPEISYGAGITGTVAYTDGTVASGATVEILYDDGTVKETVTTDETGAYAFTYAEVGQYTIRATDAEGNTSSTAVSVKRMNVFDVFVSGDTNLTLKQGWTVSGTSFANVSTVKLADETGNIFEIAETTDGTFAFTHIPNGTYVVTATTESHTASREITVFNSDVTVTFLDFPIATEVVTIWGYVEVEDRDKNHYRRNWVEITIYNDEGVAVGMAKSDGDGMYRFANLPLGEYTIVAKTSEMRPDKHHKFDRSYTLTGYAYVNAAEVGEYQAETIVLYEENDHLSNVSGKVTAEGETQDCEVVLRNVFRHEVARQTTGKNGKYSFVNVRDGLYFIFAVTKSDGMGMAVVVVREGKVYGETDIKVSKKDYIREHDDKFREEIHCNSRDEAMLHRERIAEEKRFYDGLSEKEKKQLSKDYVDRLNRYSEWIAEVNYNAPNGVTVEQGGLVVSGDEIEQEETITFNLTVEKKEEYVPNTDGVKNDDDYKYHNMNDVAGHREIKEYYEISMVKATKDGTEKAITSVAKDTDAMGKFRITMEIPEEYRGYKHYTMLHEHNGEVVTLVDLDDDPNTITFEVDKFSTFVLAASDEEMLGDISDDIVLIGDLNGNGMLDIVDALIALQCVLNGADTDADMNGDGKTSLIDVIRILKAIV